MSKLLGQAVSIKTRKQNYIIICTSLPCSFSTTVASRFQFFQQNVENYVESLLKLLKTQKLLTTVVFRQSHLPNSKHNLHSIQDHSVYTIFTKIHIQNYTNSQYYITYTIPQYIAYIYKISYILHNKLYALKSILAAYVV